MVDVSRGRNILIDILTKNEPFLRRKIPFVDVTNENSFMIDNSYKYG